MNLVRFLYILDQQNQSDSDEIQTQAREVVLNYINQSRPPVDEDEEEEEPEEEDDVNEQQPPPAVTRINQV